MGNSAGWLNGNTNVLAKSTTRLTPRGAGRRVSYGCVCTLLKERYLSKIRVSYLTSRATPIYPPPKSCFRTTIKITRVVKLPLRI